MIRMHMCDQHTSERTFAVIKDIAPYLNCFFSIYAGIDERGPLTVVEKPQIDVVECVGEWHT
ncbi:hypothetical protein WK80_23470 [Burkholderia multivorans]|nr:hypothetical protein WK80_23470 [Burkholderia multivorans]